MLAFAVVSHFVSTLLEIVEILQPDLEHDDDDDEVHFLTGRVPMLCVCVSPHHLSRSFMNQRVSLSFECLS